jgi:hypothetical protein
MVCAGADDADAYPVALVPAGKAIDDVDAVTGVEVVDCAFAVDSPDLLMALEEILIVFDEIGKLEMETWKLPVPSWLFYFTKLLYVKVDCCGVGRRCGAAEPHAAGPLPSDMRLACMTSAAHLTSKSLREISGIRKGERNEFNLHRVASVC